MEPIPSWVTHCQNERLVVCCIKTIEGINIQPVFRKDLWKASYIVWSLATSETVRNWVGHMTRGVRYVERLAVPARWHSDCSSKTVRAGSEASWESNRTYIRMVIALSVVTAVAKPAQLAAIRSHRKSLIGAVQSISSDHAEFLRELSDISVIDTSTISVLVVDLVVRLFGNSDEAAVLGVLEVQVGHPVVALVGNGRNSAARSLLCLSEVHACGKAISANDRVNVVGRDYTRAENWIRSFNYERHATAFENKVGTLLSHD